MISFLDYGEITGGKDSETDSGMVSIKYLLDMERLGILMQMGVYSAFCQCQHNTKLGLLLLNSKSPDMPLL